MVTLAGPGMRIQRAGVIACDGRVILIVREIIAGLQRGLYPSPIAAITYQPTPRRVNLSNSNSVHPRRGWGVLRGGS